MDEEFLRAPRARDAAGRRDGHGHRPPVAGAHWTRRACATSIMFPSQRPESAGDLHAPARSGAS